MFRNLFIGVTFLTLTAFGAQAQVSPPITCLVLIDANAMRQCEATTVFNNAFYAGHLVYGWYAGAPKAWAMDINGEGSVINAQEHADLLAVVNALSGLTGVGGAATAVNQTTVQAAAGTSAPKAVGVQGVTGGVPVSTADANAANVQSAAGAAPSKVVGVQGVAGGTPVPTADTNAANVQAAAGSAPAKAVGVQGVAGGVPVSVTDTNDGVAGTGISQPPGGSGLFGFISAIKSALSNTLTVAGSVALNAGSAIVGKVGIDQTTPGVTNGVVVNAALPAGANLIGATTGNAGWSESTTNLPATGGTTMLGGSRSPPAWAVYFRCRAVLSGPFSMTLYETLAGGPEIPVMGPFSVSSSPYQADHSMAVVGASSETYACSVQNTSGVATTSVAVADSFTR